MKLAHLIARWFAVILSAAIIIGLSGCSSTRTAHPLIESRQSNGRTLSLREHWRKNQLSIDGDIFENSDLLSSYGRVICRVYDPVQHSFQLKALSVENGSLLWELSDKGPYIAEVAADAGQVYAMIDFKIHAYDLKDGRHLWESQEVPSHREYLLYTDGKKLEVRDLTKELLYYFDVNTGTLLNSSSLSTSDGFVLLAQFPKFDVHTSNNAVRVVDKGTQKPLWTTDIGNVGPIKRLPVLFDNVLLVGVGEQALAIDVQTGQVKWRNQNIPFASNFVVTDDGSLYALDYNARLVRLDVAVGEEKGYIQFTPARTNPSEKRYWVATDGQMIFVSFEDSRELIALGP